MTTQNSSSDRAIEILTRRHRKKQRTPSEKEKQFEKLWKGMTPRGLSLEKRQEFRSKMKSACLQLGFDFNKHNARLYFLGELVEEEEDVAKKGEEKVYKPSRRFLRNI